MGTENFHSDHINPLESSRSKRSFKTSKFGALRDELGPDAVAALLNTPEPKDALEAEEPASLGAPVLTASSHVEALAEPTNLSEIPAEPVPSLVTLAGSASQDESATTSTAAQPDTLLSHLTSAWPARPVDAADEPTPPVPETSTSAPEIRPEIGETAADFPELTAEEKARGKQLMQWVKKGNPRDADYNELFALLFREHVNQMTRVRELTPADFATWHRIDTQMIRVEYRRGDAPSLEEQHLCGALYGVMTYTRPEEFAFLPAALRERYGIKLPLEETGLPQQEIGELDQPTEATEDSLLTEVINEQPTDPKIPAAQAQEPVQKPERSETEIKRSEQGQLINEVHTEALTSRQIVAELRQLGQELSRQLEQPLRVLIDQIDDVVRRFPEATNLLVSSSVATGDAEQYLQQFTFEAQNLVLPFARDDVKGWLAQALKPAPPSDPTLQMDALSAFQQYFKGQYPPINTEISRVANYWQQLARQAKTVKWRLTVRQLELQKIGMDNTYELIGAANRFAAEVDRAHRFWLQRSSQLTSDLASSYQRGSDRLQLLIDHAGKSGLSSPETS